VSSEELGRWPVDDDTEEMGVRDGVAPRRCDRGGTTGARDEDMLVVDEPR
jgi:hypothetical protein